MAPTQSSNIATIENANGPYPLENPFENELTRRHFIMKVYALLCVCISVTVVHICLVLNCEGFRNFLFQNQWLTWVALIAYIIASFVIACCLPLLRNTIVGIVVLTVIVEALSIVSAVTTMFYETHIILAAAFGTALLCYLVTVVAIFMPIDLTNCSFLFTVMGILFFLLVIIGSVVSLFRYIPILQLIIAFVTIIVFGIYLTFTTQLIIGGKTYQFDEHDYISATIFMYVDIVIIFLNFLTVFNYFCQ